jgi:hypothetical protein
LKAAEKEILCPDIMRHSMKIREMERRLVLLGMVFTKMMM